ncbi:uncharacterized protein LOC113355526 [Papaver somniferum]|uniref:uncharacterized protein LOC113355526 n=1 Tax=Papaver somniferum TaxID=3469 RepID=UPI000E6FA6B8|nr:uncharacterized protein LOC113355526 [Papaver somniferum]
MRSKSRVKWVIEGGANTALFHANLRIRKSQNNINELENADGNLVTTQDQIVDTLVSYYQKKFEEKQVDFVDELFEEIPKFLTDEDNMFLDAIPSQEEIKDAVFGMDANSAPGPDGFPGSFYRFAWAGNVGIKVDISQAYDTLSWRFLFEVPRRFGFSEIGIQWLKKIFESARIFVLINGGPCGFFGVGRVLRQGDPLSPIMFVLEVEVLSRNISKLVQVSKLQPMVNRGGWQPTHLMFADDIFIFCNGHKKTLENLTELLYKYQISSGQEVNKAKSKCFVGGVSTLRQNNIAEKMQMELSSFQDKYLGVILTQGIVKRHQVWGIVKMMQKMLAGWMGKLLAFSARLTLVIPSVKKLVTVKWDEVNSPVEEGGLGLRILEVINKALLMKLLWKIENEDVEWTLFMRSKYKDKNGEWIKYHKHSTIWPGLKWVISEVQEGSRWIVGDGENISVWRDKWIKDYALIERHLVDEYIMQNGTMRVKDLIHNGEWCVPAKLLQYFDASELPVLMGGKDRKIWAKDKIGNFTVSNAAQMIRKKYFIKAWAHQVWQPCIHPYTSTNLWKILRGSCATEESVRKKGFSTVSKCYLCGKAQDTMEHILWHCEFSENVWHWLCGIFHCSCPQSFDEILNFTKGKSPAVKEVWFICAFNVMVDCGLQEIM